jgi:hypothetical protein
MQLIYIASWAIIGIQCLVLIHRAFSWIQSFVEYHSLISKISNNYLTRKRKLNQSTDPSNI